MRYATSTNGEADDGSPAMAKRESVSSKSMTLADAREHFGDLLARASRGQTRILVEQDGRPVAAIVRAADLELLHHYEQQRE
jgi:prevent-host-death family protein